MSDDEVLNLSYKEQWLLAARNGDVSLITDIIQNREDYDVNLDCCGTTKSNLGWTALHLAAYFGHVSVVNLLLKAHVDTDVANNAGDTPLHKAAFTGRQDIVTSLLESGASVSIRNSDGETAEYMTRDPQIKALINAVCVTQKKHEEIRFLHASSIGDIDLINSILQQYRPPNLNCVDERGNTALHNATYRGHCTSVALLLNHGIDTLVKNHRGQLAIEMAPNEQIKQLLRVQPIRPVSRCVDRHEGKLLKKSKLFGWREVYVILERGVLTVFKNRGDASSGVKRKCFKYLENSRVKVNDQTSDVFYVFFTDKSSFALAVCNSKQAEIQREKWMMALHKHSEYGAQLLRQPAVNGGLNDSDDEDEIYTSGTRDSCGTIRNVHNMLLTSEANHKILIKDVDQLTQTINDLNNPDKDKTLSLISSRGHMTKIMMNVKELIDDLNNTINIISSQEEARRLQVERSDERYRHLEEALRTLAVENAKLECSFVKSGTHINKGSNMTSSIHSMNDEFFDCTNGDSFVDPMTSSVLVGSGASDLSGYFHSFDNASVEPSNSPPEVIGGRDHPATSMSTSFYDTQQAEIGDSDADTDEESTVVSPWGGRCLLPAMMPSKHEFSIWSILKQCIGRELSKITMPVVFNEPLSFLQRISEYMEYSVLLEEASVSDCPIRRIELVTAFAISACSSNYERIGKPFNPLLGETFELNRQDLGFRVVCEQVCHHPPISAFHADSPYFTFSGSINPSVKFWGKSIEITPKGIVKLTLTRHNETYSWQNVNCCVHNIIMGKLWIEHYGTMEIVCKETKLKSVMNFRPSSWFNKTQNAVDGAVIDDSKKKVKMIYGKWSEQLLSCEPSDFPESRLKGDYSGSEGDIKSERLLWQSDAKPPTADKYYYLTYFSLTLNDNIDTEMMSKLPITDTRLRTDIRLMESGDLEGATSEKARLEDKQRISRKQRRHSKDEWRPRWFERTKGDNWIFTNNYWQKEFEHCPDIF